MRLKNKIALITAAASGMGRAGALLFAKEGAKVVAVDIDSGGAEAVAQEVTGAGGEAIAVAADLTKDAEAKRIVHAAVDGFGGLDVVWNHVGHPGPGRIEGVDMADYELAMDLNIRSVMVTTAEALPALRARGGGSVLFTASIAGLAGSPFSPIYSAAKYGVVGLMQSMACRYAPENIRMNAVCPAPIDTPMLNVFLQRPDTQTNREENRARMMQAIPLGRVGRPEEVAAAALFLCSEEASFITGVALPVDGGYVAK
ncbi:MAG: SDR family oxidoreductase [Alphaproteobacteria bacterium]|jgi:NAD(P)-dependent dehydrogenase (short-subunit alcohol dehydrogenase family)|nr:SDR family oxidoreductase [Alphaproteobacteria bacterium]MDP6515616.1 SDR family oxidoreductase [Alphaproteobacteria bacterium]